MTEAAQKRIQEVFAVYEISQAIHNVTIDELLKLITEKAAAVMDAQACSLMLKDPQRDELVIKASYGLSSEVVEETRVALGQGIAGRVAQTGEPVLLTDLRHDPRFADSGIVPRPEIVSSICVPLKDEEGCVLGVLSIRRIQPSPDFTEDDVKLFSVFASQAALAISNSQLYASLKERVQELSILHESSRELSGAYTRENAAKVLVKLATQMADGGPAIVILIDSASNRAMIQSASGVLTEVQHQIEKALDDDFVAWVRDLASPKSIAVKGRRDVPSSIRGLVNAISATSHNLLIIPLIAEGNTIGILVIGLAKDKRVEERKVGMLTIIASQAATILRNVTTYEQKVEQKALELTALYRLSERISTAANLNEALDSILDVVRDLVPYDQCYIATVDYQNDVMTLQAWRGIHSGDGFQKEVSLAEAPLSTWVIRERKALVSSDVSKDARSRKPAVFTGVVRSLMSIPLIVQDEVVGVLNIASQTPNLYTEENVRILSIIASQAAALYKELETSSALANYTDNILRSIAVGVVTLDKDGRVLTWNKAAEEITGVSTIEASGKHFGEIVSMIGMTESDKVRTLRAINGVLETGQAYLGYKVEYHPVDNGEQVYINMNITQLRDHTGEVLGLVLIFEDVSKEIKLETEMRRISELAAVGQLAATIAHEIRNPLSSIKGAAQFLRREYEDHSAIKEFLDIIIEEVNVLNRITSEFLDFARPAKLTLKETDINDLVFRTLQFMQLDITKQNVNLEQNLSYDVPRIMADDKQIEQVLRNVVLNALQAMPDGGTLKVSTGPSNGGVCVSVVDSGVGIPEDKLEQIFVPFFTTKTKGTGLGLSIVRKIVENHGGNIRVESTVGEGTAFHIYLPICSEKARMAVAQAETLTEHSEAELLRRGHPRNVN